MAIKAGIQLSVDSKGNLKVVDLVRSDVKRLNLETKKSRIEMQKMRRIAQQNAVSLQNMGNTAKMAGLAMLGAFGVATLAGLAQKADKVRVLEARIHRVTEATGDYNNVLDELTKTAYSNGIALKETADLFINIQRSAKDLGASNDDVLTVTRSIQQMGVISGATSEAMKNSLTQLGQAFAGQVFRAEKIRQKSPTALQRQWVKRLAKSVTWL